MMQRRTLVLGGSGMLGHKLFQVLGQRHVVAATVRDPSAWSRHPLFGDPDRVIGGVEATVPETVAAAMDTVRPEVVVNCIGIVKQREEAADAARTHRVNSLFPHRLARLCGDRGCRLIHLSTDCVFSGRRGSYRENDEPDPDGPLRPDQAARRSGGRGLSHRCGPR